MKLRCWTGWLCALGFSMSSAFSAEWFVATNGNDSAVGTNWSTAKLTIQAGVDAASAGDTVFVSNGVYATGGRPLPGFSLMNRVLIDKPITVRSVNGPALTSIHGSGTTVRARCVYMLSGTLSGFSVSNGLTSGISLNDPGRDKCDASGGGLNAYAGSGVVVSNCIFSGNHAYYGGASAYATMYNCLIIGNSAQWGGGVCDGEINSCIIKDNSAYAGGGAAWATLNNCLIVGNYSLSYKGGGTVGGILKNCTVVGNSAPLGGGADGGTCNNCIVWGNSVENYRNSTFNYSCTTPLPAGTGNISYDPQFADAGSGNYRLLATSPCMDAGDDSAVLEETDLDGNPRIAYGAVDMGAYELQLAGAGMWFSAITNGLTNDLDCVAGDGVPNLLKYATGSSPHRADSIADMGCGPTSRVPTLVFNRNPNATDVDILIEGADAVSNDAIWRGVATNIGGSWGGAPNVSESGSGNPVVVTVEDPVALESNRFLRLRVTRP